jgi:hypothetical protein
MRRERPGQPGCSVFVRNKSRVRGFRRLRLRAEGIPLIAPSGQLSLLRRPKQKQGAWCSSPAPPSRGNSTDRSERPAVPAAESRPRDIHVALQRNPLDSKSRGGILVGALKGAEAEAGGNEQQQGAEQPSSRRRTSTTIWPCWSGGTSGHFRMNQTGLRETSPNVPLRSQAEAECLAHGNQLFPGYFAFSEPLASNGQITAESGVERFNSEPLALVAVTQQFYCRPKLGPLFVISLRPSRRIWIALDDVRTRQPAVIA